MVVLLNVFVAIYVETFMMQYEQRTTATAGENTMDSDAVLLDLFAADLAARRPHSASVAAQDGGKE